MVYDTHIYVGNNVLFGLNVTVATAAHPIEAERRSQQAQFNVEIHIGNNVWIGANSVVLPGVTIGGNKINVNHNGYNPI